MRLVLSPDAFFSIPGVRVAETQVLVETGVCFMLWTNRILSLHFDIPLTYLSRLLEVKGCRACVLLSRFRWPLSTSEKKRPSYKNKNSICFLSLKCSPFLTAGNSNPFYTLVSFKVMLHGRIRNGDFQRTTVAPSPCHRVVSCDKKLRPTVSLYPGV